MNRLFLKGIVLPVAVSVFLPAVSIRTALAQPPLRQLSLAERIAYQYAIEEVYWRHRIWPKDNPGAKPSLDKVMSFSQVQAKVDGYLRNSQLLANHWQLPILPEQLQAEMERMASQTKQPEVLRKVFAALGNDPFVIAECLARPVLSERWLTDFQVHDQRSDRDLKWRAESWRAGTEYQAPNCMAAASAGYTLPAISTGAACHDDTWTATSTTSAPAGRSTHPAVWTGSEMIVWGGWNGSTFFGTGGRYNPSTDSWTATSSTNAPAGRYAHTAVWTGSEMIVWGGGTGSGYFNTGGRYNPSTDSWTATSIVGAPSARYVHTAVWIGSEMIVWGGYGGTFLNTGGRYNPITDGWTPTSATGAPANRGFHTAIWTGSEMIVWGGHDGPNFNTGGRYNPGTDSWTATSTTGAPSSRQRHRAVWTGSEMIVWGGEYQGGYLNTGGRYYPGTDSWTATSTTNAPAGRYGHTAVWTGSEMIVWGGYNDGYFNTGGRYNPGMDSWIATSTTGAPSARYVHTAVETGSEMIVWGGTDDINRWNTGGRYCAQSAAPVVQAAASRKNHGSAGAFNVDLPLTGTPGIECRAGSSTNDYSIVVTFASAVTVNGSPQAQVIVGTGAVGSGGGSNGGMVTISGNILIVPLTNVASAQTINIRLNGVTSGSGSGNITIPMSILVGDTNANGAVNSADVAQAKARLGQALDATNFRSDVNVNGVINSADVSQVKALIGTGLP